MRSLYELSKLPRNQTIVVTTGAFDVPHEAHRTYLKKARKFGDILILILQSDEFIKARKGKERPIRKKEVRVRRISYSHCYESVTYIFIAENLNSLYDSIWLLNPDILILSHSTEDLETCPETMKKLFKDRMKIKVLKPLSDIHSTDIIKRRNLKKPI